MIGAVELGAPEARCRRASKAGNRRQPHPRTLGQRDRKRLGSSRSNVPLQVHLPRLYGPILHAGLEPGVRSAPSIPFAVSGAPMARDSLAREASFVRKRASQ
jgi:hypothetical protein